MEARIQQLLDEQWDTLEARSPKIKHVRQRLGLVLGEFAALKQEESLQLQTSITDTRSRVQLIQKTLERRDELQKQLEVERSSPLAQELAVRSDEVHELDRQIQELQAKRAAAEQRRREVESVVASRTAKFRDAIADLNGRIPPEDAAKVHSLQSQLARLGQQKSGVDAESSAAESGQAMWQQVCHHLDDLDHEIRSLRRDQLDRVSFLLKHKITILEGYLNKAHESGWTALVVAVGHELQILQEALNALNDAEHGSQRESKQQG